MSKYLREKGICEKTGETHEIAAMKITWGTRKTTARKASQPSRSEDQATKVLEPYTRSRKGFEKWHG